MSYDLAIIGLGAHGSSILHRAAQEGLKVIGLDQFSPPHTKGSHHGDTRITRLSHFKSDHLLPLIIAGYSWRETFENPVDPLFIKTGYLRINSSSDNDIVSFIQESARRYNFDVRRLNSLQLKNKFPIFNVSDDSEAVLETVGGYLRSEAIIATNLTLAKKYGAQIVLNERTLSFESGRVTSKSLGIIRAKKIILAAGAFMTDLVPEITKLLKPTRQYVTWFKIKKNYEWHKIFNCPTFVWPAASKRLFYGFPAIDGPEGGFKIGVENDLNAAPRTDPHRHKSDVTPAEIRKAYGDITEFFPFLSNEYVKAAACMYTLTPDEEFIIDKHPSYQDVWICSACSSHGFKFCHGIGIMMTDIVKDGTSPLWSKHFSYKRFL